MSSYQLNVAGLVRNLPIYSLSDTKNFCIAGFVILGDVELTTECAKHLNGKLKDSGVDLAGVVFVTPECKAIGLAQEMARLCGHTHYVVARKEVKGYMTGCKKVVVKSTTTGRTQELILDREQINLISGKNVVLVDDVRTSGASLEALANLVTDCDATVITSAVVLAEGNNAWNESGFVYLEKLPLIDAETHEPNWEL